MNLWQSQEWRNLQESLGNEIFLLNNIFVLKKNLPKGLCFYEVQRANPDADFWEALEKRAIQEKGIFCRIAPDYYPPLGKEAYKNKKEELTKQLHIPRHLTTQTSRGQRFPDATRIVDLSPNEEEIFAQFTSTCRRHIRQAQKGEVYVEESTDYAQFAELSRVTAERDGFFAHSAKHFEKFCKALEENVVLLVAKKEEKWLSAGIFITLGEESWYYYGASSAKERNLNAPTFLQFEAMKWAKEKGAKSFDLLGVAPNDDPKHKLAGVTRFKKKFGGDIRIYFPETNVVFSPLLYCFYRIAKTLRGFLRRS